MRWSATLGGWNRRKTVLAAFLVAAAALAALAVPLKLPWLGVAGLVVAAVGAMASLVISTEQARLEGKHEDVRLGRRVKVPVAPITEIDPTEIGVDPAATTELGGTVPEYVKRKIDDKDLRPAIEAALTGTGSWMLVVEGPSKVGKSRTLFEALSTCSVAEKLQLVAPVDGEALRSLLDPGQPMATRPEYAVLSVAWAALGCRVRRGVPSRASRLPRCRSSPGAQAHNRAARARGAGVPGRGGGGVCRRRLGPVRTHRPDQRRHASGIMADLPTGDDAQRRAFCHWVGVGVAAGRRDGSPAAAAARRPRVPRL